MTLKPFVVATTVLWLASAAMPAFAQVSTGPGTGGTGLTPPSPPPAGTSGRRPTAWFGGGVGDTGQSLTGSLTLGYGRFEQNLKEPLPDQLSRSDTNFSSASGSLYYNLDRRRFSLSSSIYGALNHYPSVIDEVFNSYGYGVGASYQLSRRTTIDADTAMSYSPPFLQTLQGLTDPGQVPLPPPVLDTGLLEERSKQWNTSVGIQHRLTSRSDLTGSYGHMVWESQTEGAPKQVTDDASIRYNHQLARGLAAFVGYRYGRSRVEVEEGEEFAPVDRSGIDAGINFNRALSISRNTTVTFGGGVTSAKEVGAESSQWFLVGNAAIDHKMGRSWTTGAGYSRDANFVPGIQGMVIGDRIFGHLDGRLSRRVSWGNSISWTRGDVGFENANSYTTMQASSTAGFALTAGVGASVNYTYYLSDFATFQGLLSPTLAKAKGHTVSGSIGWSYYSFGVSWAKYEYLITNNQSLSFNFSMYAPLFNRARRPDATR